MRNVLHPMSMIERLKRATWVSAMIWTVTATCATAQMGHVVGQVTDADGFPLAAVEVQGGGASGLTDPGGIYMLEGVAQESRVVVQFKRDGLATTYGIVDLAPKGDVDDSDGDGIPDDVDDCPFSELSPTVVIDGCDSGVENVLLDNGCTISDLVQECADTAKNHGKFVRCVKELTRTLKAEDVISKEEAKRISRCAARSDIPPRDDDSSSKDSKSKDSKSKDSRSDDDSSEDDAELAPAVSPAVAAVPTFATLNKVMVPCGDVQLVDAVNGGMVEQDGFRVTFLPGSIAAVGEVEVVVCPIDVALPELGAFPGDFLAVPLGSGDLVLLETFSLMDVSLTQNGLPVDLADGQEATLEFLLPESTPLLPGDTIGLWFFDSESGLWFEEEVGLVGESSFDPARLSVVGTVSHFSWWNCDQPIQTFSCIQGVVRDADGNPVPNAQVIASGVDYNGASYRTTDENGEYCLNVRIDSIVEVTATALAGIVQSASEQIATGAANVTCALGGCIPLDLALPAASCIEGVVLDVLGAPLEGVLVRSTAGSFATSAADGTFCLIAPADTVVSLLVAGFNVESVLTPGAGPTCDTSGCAQVVLQEPPIVSGTACISGAFIPDDFNPEGELVAAFDAATDTPVGTVGVMDENYAYCIQDVPLDLDVYVESVGQFCNGASSDVFNTGAAEGDCSNEAGCVVAPTLDCFGGGEFF